LILKEYLKFFPTYRVRHAESSLPNTGPVFLQECPQSIRKIFRVVRRASTKRVVSSSVL
jgi:hypothetical protein